MKNNKKIVLWNDTISTYPSKGKTVLVGGCFDIIHLGHMQFLKNAKKEGDILIIALESDEFMKNRKYRIPIHNQIQRAEILSEFSIVDLIILLPYFSTDDQYYQLVKKINPDVIAITENDPYIGNKQKQAKLTGAKVKVVLSQLPGFSTKKIREAFGI
ncbi:MAG: Glycerol-3-phosphate cytidyltransferase TagD [Candidatus Roizmanbacteria bacterium GW2011_GWA2_36_23]|uniref:Glycerol-3-phosphate cytidyltransferase TagD n=1 Tax=Candidatus Roizmanbacteria bacterium GW2011_GWA2_36_23 TaxID=1618480 RepID=A0A0G0E5D1_9BACT|nr:MAG: Glycerol-3-phosphate cytidyltransferase TagD [Candidatus Roizmanbacteria bacterium GW2011_GWA2_36_23]